VCSGTTGHTEAIQVVYDPRQVSFEKLVRIGMERLGDSKFLLNQVGNDKGTQYRHGIYYHNDEQNSIAESIIQSFGDKCVTECLPAKKFFMAEDYHQQYLLKGGQPANKNNKQTIRCYG
jgi:peptide-methionine (S)-S-oxide reductase